MSLKNAFVHMFRIPGGCYIYDVNRNTVLKVDEKVYKAFINSNELNDDSIMADIEKYRTKGYFASKRINEVKHPCNDTLAFYLENRVRMISLQVTQECNFRCKYCAYSGNYKNRMHSSKRMSFELAKKGIDFLISHSGDVEQVSIGFYGGEPLLEFDLIKRCIEYVKDKYEGKSVLYTITTNGTLLTEDIVSYLSSHDVSLMISLDGPEKIHDKNRMFARNGCGTFKEVMKKIDMINTKFPEYGKKIHFNIVLDPENEFSCVSDFFANCDLVKDSTILSTIIDDRYTDNHLEVNEDFEIQYGYEHFKAYLGAAE